MILSTIDTLPARAEDGEQEAHLIALACSPCPEGQAILRRLCQHKGGARFRGDTPTLFQPGMTPVFFSTLRTVSWLTCSTESSSTSRSAKSRKVQRACPAGQELQK